MIQAVWPYLALMLLIAGLFPMLERRTQWRVFSVMPPIVMVYLLVTGLSVAGLWKIEGDIQAAQKTLIAQILPAMLFLLMIHCDLRNIFRLGPRVLAVFFSTTVCLFIAFVTTYLIFRYALPANTAWQPLAALSGSWVGGSANLVAVAQGAGLSEQSMALALLTDALCYSVWVAVLFSVGRLAPAFDRWTRAISSADIAASVPESKDPITFDAVLLWLGLALGAGVVSRALAALLPESMYVSPTSYTIMIATVLGLVVAHTPLARFPGSSKIASALLIFIVAILASQSNFEGIGAAPWYLACGLSILIIHAVLLALLAKLFRFDLYLCGISSLAHVGGVAATPVLAASYSPALVPVGILLALLGYILGTGFGLVMAQVLTALAP
ncbi:putative integral membrane protein [Lysobacter dokdonensis DS-58]|uniref:Putative integral membrane protein n=1 Tax=Lysobacter dokdonensis DS-58 TaxID=1300345 RepID=A0A0A2WQI6_9GAMM|nr:DUF819 family protein [Lysobacter dokdonensis]KGQ20550.1 putative integral membrane protein [Lysobacter dokdonensis DS-58]